MAVWATQSEGRLTVRHLAVLPLAAGLGIVAAILVPAVYEALSSQPASWREQRPRLTRAALVLAATLAVCPLTSLRADAAGQAIRWRRWRLLGLAGVRRRELPMAEVRRIETVRRPHVWLLARNVVSVRGADRSLVLPLGWSAASAARDPARDVACQIERCIVPSQAAVPAEAARPRPPVQVSLRRMLAAVTLGAAVCGVSTWIDWSPDETALPATIVLAAAACGYALLARRGTAATECMAAAIAMYAPFAWIAAVSEPWGQTSGMWGAVPLVPGSWAFVVVRLIGGSQHDALLPVAAATLLQFAITAVLALRGWSWTLPWLLLIGLVSCVMSLGMYAGYRA